MDRNQPPRRARGKGRDHSGPPLSAPPSSINALKPQSSGQKSVGPRQPSAQQPTLQSTHTVRNSVFS